LSGGEGASSERRIRLLRLLADGAVHSGAELAAALGVTRAAVWKMLRTTAEELSLELTGVRGKGYRLDRPLELLDPAVIEAALSAPVRERLSGVEVLQSIDSTNGWLMARAAAGAPSGLVCLAERQLAGRGRSGRTWVSPFGANIYLSLLWRYGHAPMELGGLSLACGVAAAQALQASGVPDIGLKWPNDLHWRRRKLGGLLLEVAGEAQGPSHVVVGIGINVRLSDRDAEGVDQPWTDLERVLMTTPGTDTPGRNALAARLIDGLGDALVRYGEQGLAPFLPAWRALDIYLGEPISVVMGEQTIAGICAGIGDDGALLLDTDAGRRTFRAGEVSLRSAVNPT
jgi:BirA family biotin operon repressor/biotin-[acetyl-CoA-carboxylase] ligase